MIKEEYIKFETAKLLKTAGFPQDIKQTAFFNKHGQDYHFGDGAYNDGCAQPTQAQAMRWLREKTKFDILIDHGSWDNIKDNIVPSYRAVLVDIPDYVNFLKELVRGTFAFREEVRTEDFPTYEAAAEAGIQAACQYIISKGKE